MTIDRYVTDTHPLIWHLTDDSRLGHTAKSVFSQADSGAVIILVPPIVMVEMIYLSEKGRIQEQMVSDLLDEIKRPLQSYQLGGWGEKVIEAVRQIPRNLIPEMPDRIIAATAKSLNIPLITCDGQIVNSNTVNVVW